MRRHPFLGASDIVISPPRRAASVPAVGSFVICPVPIRMGSHDCAGWAPELYRLAYEQAQAVLRPPWHVRTLFASMN